MEITNREINFGTQRTKQNNRGFCTNFIKTSKYNIISFLPISLLLQFKRYPNVYFLIAAIMMCIPSISTASPISSIAPLIFVILLSMIREGIEDLSRHQNDKILNNSPCKIYRDGKFVLGSWTEVLIADILLIEADEIISADCIILSSFNKDGTCFIETSSLDGEKNLKPKQTINETQNYNESTFKDLGGKVGCIPPNPHIFSFEGSLELVGKQQKIGINAKNLVLRGSKLKNVPSIFGMVVYTGKDTKVMKNSGEGRNKVSHVEANMNTYTIYILLLQLILCVIVSILNITNCGVQSNITLVIADESCTSEFFLTWARYLLLLNTMLPISLIVSLEFVKFGQGYLMQKDKQMFVQQNDKFLKIFNVSINEELGQIEYVFTDKTGTLTCNKMEFKMLICGKNTYGQEDTNDGLMEDQFSSFDNKFQILKTLDSSAKIDDVNKKPNAPKDAPTFNFDATLINKAFNLKLELKSDDQIFFEGNQGFKIQTQTQLIIENLLILACNHECVIDKIQENDYYYQGPSPDEICLVDAANKLGVKYLGKDQTHMSIFVRNEEKKVELLQQFEFNSDRKRMSTIIKDQNGIIKLYIKGADSLIKARLGKNQPFLQYVDQKLEYFSRQGLRTLSLAMKVFTDQEYKEINDRILACIGQPKQEEKILEIAEDIEKELILIGATAVEDKLQPLVPETLADLLKANIKVWMLTGDKLETAENIGKSCNMITELMNVQFIRYADCVDITARLMEVKKIFETGISDGCGLLIEGEALAQILPIEKSILILLEIIIKCKSVICCRVTPKQKADVVRLVKTRLKKITLSVGDGANDVNMIQEADIGVGIYGNEGLRAVQSSDYAMGEFRVLWHLILFHGRMNYIRVSECILYFFYKNMIFTVCQFYFAFYCRYSGQSIYEEWYMTFYNMIFTFWPIVLRSVYEKDVGYGYDDQNDQSSMIRSYYPRLYYIGQKNTIFQHRKFSKWIIQGALQGLACYYIHYGIYIYGVGNSTGIISDIWMLSISLYTSIIFLVNIKLAIMTTLSIWQMWVAYILTSFGAYFIYIWLFDQFHYLLTWKTAEFIFGSPLFYLGITLSFLSMMALDLTMSSFKNSKKNLLNYMKQSQGKGKMIDVKKIAEYDDQLKQQFRNEDANNSKMQKKLQKKIEKIDLDQKLLDQNQIELTNRNMGEIKV